MNVDMTALLAAWKKIYQKHWDTCTEPTCSICCRKEQDNEQD
jgi:hypothetical protein